jgi:hypothetical protein
MIAFTTSACEPESSALAHSVVKIIQASESRIRVRKAKDQVTFEQGVDLVLGDLLKAYAGDSSQWAYRATGISNFTGEPVGYKTWHRIMPVLQDLGYVDYHVGTNHQNPFDDGYIAGSASRFRATKSLIALAESKGVNLELLNEQYHTALPKSVLRLKSSKHGELQGTVMDFAITPQAQAIIDQVENINEYLAQQTLTGGVFEGYRRGFNLGDEKGFDWNQGGRLYAVGSGYQQLPGDTRAAMLINGEAVVEVDVSASHLSIYVGLMGHDVSDGADLYVVEGIDREVVKAYVTASFGQGKLASTWPNEIDVDIEEVKQTLCKTIPCFKALGESGYDWATFQFLEAEAIIEAMESLQEIDIPAYSVHDSLIVPESGADKARAAIRKAWRSRGWPIALG